MHIRVGGHGARGTAKVIDGLVEFAEFFESAAEVVARDAVERIDLHGVKERVARVSQLAELVVRDAEIDVSFDPVGGEVDDTLIILNGLGQGVRLRFAIESGTKEIFGRRPGHGVKFRGLRGHIERKPPLLKKRIERNFRARRHDVNFAAQVDEAELVQRQGRRAKLFFNENNRAFYFAGGDVILREALERAKSDEVHEAVKTLAPPCFGTNQPQAFPVAETVRLKTKNAASFRPRIPFRQFLKTPAEENPEGIMH